MTIQAVDSANNVMDRTITVTIADKTTVPTTKLYLPPVTGTDAKGLAEMLLDSLRDKQKAQQ